MIGKIKTIDYCLAKDFLLPKHYSGRTPSISYAFGWYIANELVAVCTFGKPASPFLCRGVCGADFSPRVFELNRLCRVDSLQEPLSYFVSACLRKLRAKNLIIVSYSDTQMNHHGYIYQACNFIYTGKTKERTDKYTEGNKHARHYSNSEQNGLRKIRSAKHRYIYFAMKDKKIRESAIKSLNYETAPYPKGDNKNYTLGEYLKPRIKNERKAKMGTRKDWRLSASSISSLKFCPFQYFLKYVKRIRRVEEPDHFRMGTNWHTVMEVMSLKPGEVCACVFNKLGGIDPDCLICQGIGENPDNIMLAVSRVIDDAYSRMPGSMDPEKWAVERAKLLYGAAGYRWYYSEQPLNTVLREFEFDTPVPNEAGRAIPNLKVVGFVDKVVDLGNSLAVIEHKTTSSQIDPDSKYWGHLSLDTQTTLYLFIMRMLQNKGELPELKKPISGLYYDVFKKPGISPKMLTMADSKKFVEGGMYFNQKFEVTNNPITVDSKVAEVEPCKKPGTFKIRETPDMYGARFLADIAERPEYYFVRKEIPKTDAEINRFHKELLGVLASMKSHYKLGSWYHCERQCEATYHCDYIDLCYNGVDPDGDLPEGLIRKEETNGS